MNREEKSAVVDRIRTSLDGAPSVILTDFCGLKVSETDELRSELRANEIRFEVVKNTLAQRAVMGTPMEGLNEHFRGNTAIVYHQEDPVAPARFITKFVKDHAKLKVKAGWLDGKIIDGAGVEALSKLPGKDELRAQLLSVLVGTPTQFVRVLQAGPAAFARLLQARADSLGE